MLLLKNMKKCFKFISLIFNKIYRRVWFFYHYFNVKKRQDDYIKYLKEKDCVNIVFFAFELSEWKYQNVYEKLKLNPKYNVHIVLSPYIGQSEKQQEGELNKLRSYFQRKGTPYIDYKDQNGKVFDVRNALSPDILFYPQPVNYLLHPLHNYHHFVDKLLCYVPYCFQLTNKKNMYNTYFMNLAWKLYYSNNYERQVAASQARNRGRNVVVTGMADSDDFARMGFIDNWKIQDSRIKRIIWAPHFTISDDVKTGAIPISNFLKLHSIMLSLAKEYRSKIQIAFKPHPRLLQMLYLHKDWGIDKTDWYYNEWKTMQNTQLETGDFIDLFMTSDAMIHDSSSFCIEYHYTHKPVMFVSNHTEDYLTITTKIAQDAIHAHYIGTTEFEIRKFIDDVVLGGNDAMKHKRWDFYNKYLRTPNNQSVAENICNDLVKSLGFNE